MNCVGVGTRANEYYAYFTVTGEFAPDEISAQLGLQPTDCWMKGDRNERTHLERKFSRWSLYTRLDHAVALEAHVDDVLEQLELVRERVVDLVEELTGEMVLVGHFYRDYPGLHFEASTLSKLAALNVDVDMDFYYMYSDRREDS